MLNTTQLPLRRDSLGPLVGAVLALLCTACEPKQAPQPEPNAFTVVPRADIQPDQARDLVLERYRALFAPLYIQDLRSGEYRHFGPLQRSDLRQVETDGTAWVVRCNRLAGFHLSARVAKDGSWVEFLDVGYAAH